MIMPIAWKEWHEQRWRLAFGTVMLTGLIGSLAAARVITESEIMVIFWGAATVVLPLYSAMGVFAPEHTAGTFTFYAAKPARPFRVFITKWFFGWLNVVVPVVVTVVFTLLVAGGSLPRLANPDLDNLFSLLVALCFGTVFYTMTSCLAPSRRGEAFVGLCGLLILGLMAMYPFALAVFLQNKTHLSLSHYVHPVVAQVLFSIDPVAIFDPRISEQPRELAWITYVVQAVIFPVIPWVGYLKWRRHW
jgi:hypothetical protein